MRLTKIKLAGFKTFVDPTVVLFPGQLVGVVGPNGCGKSNVIDAVRWVLGESKATALRGESMQDVIFNGSTTRKPVGRASVELSFDNSMGKALGQWSRYAEIAVKRVLERDGNSSYFINNAHVRRRDVVDLFLGTGLGPRAYAIVEQGMISRMVEARPEELRLFLEEAAGVTKYKERRRETEHRLEDANENLARVEDISGELAGQIERLAAQAEVARRFRELQAQRGEVQNLFWLLKRNEARSERERALREVEKTSIRMEAEVASLRHTEGELERARQSHFRASDAVHGAQSGMYEVNAELARLEDERSRRRETAQRLDARQRQLELDEAHWRGRLDSAGHDAERWNELLDHARQRAASAESRHASAAGRLPVLERGKSGTDAVVIAVRRELAEVEQQLRVEQTHADHAARALEALRQRKARLDEERGSMSSPDEALIEELRMRAARTEEALERGQALADALQDRLPELETRKSLAADGERVAQRRLTEVRARRDALQQVQEKVVQASDLGEWLVRHDLDARAPLWQALRVEPGWERAVEAVLRERLAAFAVEPGRLPAIATDAPPATVALGFLDEVTDRDAGQLMTIEVALAEKIGCGDPRWIGVLANWLYGVSVAEDVTALVERRHELGPGQLWVDREGRMLSRCGVVVYSPDVRTHGVLERQREIEELGQELEAARTDLEAARQAMASSDSLLREIEERIAEARREIQEHQQQRHGFQVELLKLTQAHSRYVERVTQIETDLSEIEQGEAFERDRIERAGVEIARCQELIEALHGKLAAAVQAQRSADSALREAQAAEQALSRELQEARFSERECAGKLEDIAQSRETASHEFTRVTEELAATRSERSTIDESEIEARLQASLDLRSSREKALAGTRSDLEQAAVRLRELEEQRLRTEQGIGPLRERLGELKLKAQAAELLEQQHQARLAEAEADEKALAPLLTKERKESALQQEISRIASEIEQLGAVNLAALEELSTARERRDFLDAQTADLRAAIATLEDAIRRIDRETREQLRETFERVNDSFGRLFPELFGGGEARLVLTGEEILDAGVQVMAHPPGKRNASIHLLSGGEKALTATALVFALFQLNPAPFCMLDEVDAPLDDANTVRFCEMVKRMAHNTQFVFVSHNKITMEMAEQLIGVTMQEQGVSHVVEVDIEEALRLREEVAAA